MTQRLLDLYRAVAKTANLVAGDDGMFYTLYNGKKEPALIKDKRLVLPTKEHLSNPDWTKRVPFHPLSENLLREKETPVLENFRAAVNLRLQYTLVFIGQQLITLIASTGDHKKLNPEQSEILSQVKDVDEKTLDDFLKLCAAMPPRQTSKTFVNIYLKKGGKLPLGDGERSFSRLGVVSFPLYHELQKSMEKDDDAVWGVKIPRKKSRRGLMQLLEYIFPRIKETNAYSRGSNSELAPFMDALMKSVAAVADPINTVMRRFNNRLSAHEDLFFEDDWVEAFDNIDSYGPDVRTIPMLQAGDTAAPAPAPAPAPAAAAPAPAAYPWNNPQPTQVVFPSAATAPPPVPHTPRGGVDFEQLLRTNPRVAAAAGMGFSHQMTVGNPNSPRGTGLTGQQGMFPPMAGANMFQTPAMGQGSTMWNQPMAPTRPSF